MKPVKKLSESNKESIIGQVSEKIAIQVHVKLEEGDVVFLHPDNTSYPLCTTVLSTT